MACALQFSIQILGALGTAGLALLTIDIMLGELAHRRRLDGDIARYQRILDGLGRAARPKN